MLLAPRQTEVTGHIKTQLPQRQGVSVGIQEWYGGTNNMCAQCQGKIIPLRHLLWEQGPACMLLWRNTLTAHSLWVYSVMKGVIFSPRHCCLVWGLLCIIVWLGTVCHMVSNYYLVKPMYKKIQHERWRYCPFRKWNLEGCQFNMSTTQTAKSPWHSDERFEWLSALMCISSSAVSSKCLLSPFGCISAQKVPDTVSPSSWILSNKKILSACCLCISHIVWSAFQK